MAFQRQRQHEVLITRPRGALPHQQYMVWQVTPTEIRLCRVPTIGEATLVRSEWFVNNYALKAPEVRRFAKQGDSK